MGGHWSIWAGVVALALSVAGTAGAQVLPVPNPSFEEGSGAPANWTLSGGEGAWQELEGASGTHAVVVKGTGQDSNFWRSEPLPMESSAVYRLKFRGRNLDATGGVGMSGPAFCNRDLGSLRTDAWKDYTSFFMAPKEITPEKAWIRFGQWHEVGSVAYDDIQIVRVVPVYSRAAGFSLGDGEMIQGNQYTFAAPLASSIGNHSRPLAYLECGFNTNRWVFYGASEVVYRQALEGRKQTAANVTISLSNRVGGKLIVEASIDGLAWREIGQVPDVGSPNFPIPADMLPADAVWIRMRSATDQATELDPASGTFSVDAYVYIATVDGDPVNARGITRYVAVQSVDPRFSVAIDSVGEASPDAGLAFAATVTNTTGAALTVPYAFTAKQDGTETPGTIGQATLNVEPTPLNLPYALTTYGPSEVRLTIGEAPGFVAEWGVSLPILYAGNYGQKLPPTSDAVGLWWASSGWKISQTRPLPEAAGDAATVSIARNETEALQLVLRPTAELKGLTAQAKPLTGPNGAVLPAESIEILRERYVNVVRPTDASTGPGLWPDPLPPFREPITVAANTNQPLWVRVHAPKDLPAGTYTGTIGLTAEGYQVEAPLSIVVYDFALPDRMTCVSAFGFTPNHAFQYQKVTDPAQQREVLDKYLTSFAKHHITPYDPAPLDPFNVTWPQTTDPAQLVPTIDWTAWDAAMTKAFDGYFFNSFQLPSPGMGGGTFHSRVEPDMLGFKEGTPEYTAAFNSYYKAVQEHLREKGWLDEAYVYWFDEPDPKDYEFVMNGFRKLKEAAPDIVRMLTEQVEPGLVGGPNLWCPISNDYNHDAAEVRRAEGEKFWWYVCTGPKAPYATLFLDHPATELRVWLWQTWQRKIDGILIWQSNYWNSPEAYPGGLQNPYEDPMSWQTSYGIPPGTQTPWGNGDGRFIYPPEAAASGQQEAAVLEGPVDSIRWEMLRDGLEDYEYMVTLRRLLTEKAASITPEQKAQYEPLLQVPAAITTDMTTFTKDPAPIEAHREAVARAIEVIGKLP
jgi:hypothetical protein